MQTFLYTLHFIACFVLIGVVLLQRGKGADLGASLGGGGANTIFGSRGAGNFLSRITTASAIVFMGTSLSLSYLGYQASDIQLFPDGSPIDVEGGIPLPENGGGGLEEIPDALGGAAANAVDGVSEAASGALMEIKDQAGGAAEAVSEGASEAAGALEGALENVGE